MALFASKQTYFELAHLAGEGLNSCVYKALRRDVTGTISQVVALKILKSKDNVLFWRQEVQSLLQVNSPYCVKVFDFEWVNNQPAMVLEWFEGVTLAQLFKETDVPNELAKEIILQTQEGLVDLYLSNLCHGDLHMENVFITADGQIKLLDFGMANISRFKSQGAPAMRAPEFDLGCQTPSLWSDLFALGVISKQLGCEQSILLEPLPENRDLISGKQSPNQRTLLSTKVQLLLKKREILSVQKTCATGASKKELEFKTMVLSFLLLLIVSLVPGASSSIRSLPPCMVELRSIEWQEVQINDGPTRFSPGNYFISSCGNIQVRWRNARGHGVFERNLKHGEVLKLRDKDFR